MTTYQTDIRTRHRRKRRARSNTRAIHLRCSAMSRYAEPMPTRYTNRRKPARFLYGALSAAVETLSALAFLVGIIVFALLVYAFALIWFG